MPDFLAKFIEYVRPLSWPFLLAGLFILFLGSDGSLGPAVQGWLREYQAWLVIATVLAGAVVFTQVMSIVWSKGRLCIQRRHEKRQQADKERREKSTSREEKTRIFKAYYTSMENTD